MKNEMHEYTGSKSTLTLDRGLHASAEQHHTLHWSERKG